MKNKINLSIIILFLICVSLVLICSKSSDNTTILDEVRLKDVKEENSMFAIMIQQEVNSDNYTLYEEATWPTDGYTFNSEKSGCLDGDGKKLTNTKLEFIDGKVKLETSNTSYCYIYFDKEQLAIEILKAKVGTGGLKETNTGDLQYRFVGTQEQDIAGNINNYVCFGDNNCSSYPTNDHMYRIIGITSDGRIKIQKNKDIGTAQWYYCYIEGSGSYSYYCGNGITIPTWSGSNIYTITLKNFYENKNYITEAMIAKIENHVWNTGMVGITSDCDGITIYNAELGESQTHKSNYGLTYISDYYFAYNELGNQYCDYRYNCKSWMIPTETDRSSLWSGADEEWTMTNFGRDIQNQYHAWGIAFNGAAGIPLLNNYCAVRPVLYLKNDVTISSGSGSLNDPFIIN